MLSSMGNTKMMLPAAPIVDVVVTADMMKLIPIIHFRCSPTPFFLLMITSSTMETSSITAAKIIKNGITPISGTVKCRSTDIANSSEVRATNALMFRWFAELSIMPNNPAFPLDINLSDTKLVASVHIQAESLFQVGSIMRNEILRCQEF